MVNVFLSDHAKRRLRERFNIEGEAIEKFIKDNFEDACVYSQGSGNKLVVGRNCSLGIKVNKEGWLIITAMSGVPGYHIPSHAGEMKQKINLVI